MKLGFGDMQWGPQETHKTAGALCEVLRTAATGNFWATRVLKDIMGG